MPPRSLVRRCALLAAGLQLAACASVAPPVAPSIPEPPAHWQGAADDRGDPDIAQWWRGLGDSRLTALVEDALRANPDLGAARAALREARSLRSVAAAALGPAVDGAASASRGNTGGRRTERYSLAVDASWEADLFGARRLDLAAAAADAQRVEARLADVQVSLAAEVALQYVALISAERRLAIARANLASQSETLQLTKWRVQAGLASSVELEQARSNREQTAATIPQFEASRGAAEHALAALTGAAPGTLALAPGSALPAVPARIAAGIPAALLHRRPDLRAAERAFAAESARVGVAAAARYPALRLSGSIGSDALTLGALGSAASLGRSLLAGLTAPLFDGGRRQGQLEAQEAARDQAFEAYRGAVLAALQEVEDALLALERGRTREAALQRSTEAARHAALLARQRYQSGLIDFQTVLDTERSLRAAEDSLAGAEADQVTTLVKLYKALGGGWTPGPEPQERT